jgi:hypothetical protein
VAFESLAELSWPNEEVVDIVVLRVGDVEYEAGEITEAGDSVALTSEVVEALDRNVDIFDGIWVSGLDEFTEHVCHSLLVAFG